MPFCILNFEQKVLHYLIFISVKIRQNKPPKTRWGRGFIAIALVAVMYLLDVITLHIWYAYGHF